MPGNDQPQAETGTSDPRSARADPGLLIPAQLAAEIAGGFAEAVAAACRAFSDEVKRQDRAQRGLANGVVGGLLSSQTAFYRKMADAADDLETRTREAEPQHRAVVALDYDRLAEAIARAIGANKADLNVRESVSPKTSPPP